MMNNRDCHLSRPANRDAKLVIYAESAKVYPEVNPHFGQFHYISIIISSFTS